LRPLNLVALPLADPLDRAMEFVGVLHAAHATVIQHAGHLGRHHWTLPRAASNASNTLLGLAPDWSIRTGTSSLQPSFKWSGNDAVSFAAAHGQSFRIVSSDEPQLFRKFTPGDLVLPAQYALQRLVSRKLKEHASSANLLWDWQRTHPDLRIQLVPSSLISALWLQLAMAIDGNRNYRRCESCTRWFELSGDARGDAKFCRQACQFKAYRTRQNRAREMAAQHKSAREIAAELDTEVSTVKGWLKK
jgi:hypothetical protein